MSIVTLIYISNEYLTFLTSLIKRLLFCNFVPLQALKSLMIEEII